MSGHNRTYTVAKAQQQHRVLAPAGKAERAQHAGQYFTLLLFGAFVILLLLGLWMGTVAFRAITIMQNTTDDARLALNSLQNRVRSFDEADSFSIGNGPEGPSMVFTYKLDAGNYETRIYLYEGFLVQELAFSTDPYLPMTATKIVETSTFWFAYNNGLLTITTDQGSAKVALRAEASSSAASQPFATSQNNNAASNTGSTTSNSAQPNETTTETNAVEGGAQ